MPDRLIRILRDNRYLVQGVSIIRSGQFQATQSDNDSVVYRFNYLRWLNGATISTATVTASGATATKTDASTYVDLEIDGLSATAEITLEITASDGRAKELTLFIAESSAAQPDGRVDTVLGELAYLDEIALSQIASGTQGYVLYYGSDGRLTTLAPGTTGQFLKTLGSGANPAWATPAGSGDALTSASLAQFAATTSAELRGVLSDETGTGAAVFAGSPALTGSPTAPTQTPADNSTKLATTAYVEAAVAAIPGGGDLVSTNNLSDLTNAGTARTNLGLAIGTNVQAYDADLTTWAGLTPSANAQSLVTAANYAAMRGLLDLEAGTDFYSIAAADAAFQAKDADLTTWAGLTPSANAQSLVTAANYAAMVALLESDIEAAIDTLANLTSVQGLTITLADAGADALLGWDDSASAYQNLSASDARAALGLAALYQPLDATLTALAAYNTNGILTQTAADTFAGRTLAGTAAQITVTNGDGVSGNPTLSLPADVLIPTVLTVPNTGLHILDTNASHDLIIAPGSNITADRTLTLTTGDADRTLTISASATVSQDYSTTGNPQFATIELGAASDTTMARSAAGVVTIEGVEVVTLSRTQTLTAKTLTDPAIIGTILEDVYTITDGAAFEIDPGNGSIQLITLGANRTPAATNFAAGESVTLMIADGTAYTITWTTVAVTWVGGSAPTLATSGYTVVELWKVGSTIYGARVGDVA